MTNKILDYSDKKEVVTIERGFTGTHNELYTAIDNEYDIIDFKGGAKIPKSRLSEKSTIGIKNSEKVKMQEVVRETTQLDEEGNEVVVEVTVLEPVTIENEDGEVETVLEQKTWEELAIITEAEDGEYLVKIADYHGNSKCHEVVTPDQLRLWIQGLGKTNIVTKSEMKTMRKQVMEEV